MIKHPSDCCGCTACASICAHDAITMKPDTMGFLYPIVNVEKCVDCGLCEKVCAFNDHYDTSLNLPQPNAYAARHNNIHEIETSRSGAVFVAVSDFILEQGGVVYGAGYSDHFRVVHKRATTKEERNEFKGSKYVQSDLNNVFRQIKNDLKQGLLVLFSGTPCQVAGLNAYIGNKLRSNLVLIDIICHGVPGPNLWHDYLSYIENKVKDKICYVNFRDKQKFGWNAHKETFEFVNGKRDNKWSFAHQFYQSILFRLSCSKCHYCNLRRPSDITIGDFWGWQNVVPDFNKDDRGVSLVLTNTAKGCEIFYRIKDRLTSIPVRLKDCLQPNLQHPSPLHPKRLAFELAYKQKGFAYAMRKYGNWNWEYKMKRIMKRIARRLQRLFSLK